MGEDDFYDPMSGYDMGSGGDVSAAPDPDFGSYPSAMGGGDAPWGVNRLPVIAGGLSGNPGRVAMGGGLARGAGRVAGIATRYGMVSARKAWDLVKKLGPELAAGALGYSVVDLMTAIVAGNGMSTRRRRRGLSGRDIRTTRRVCRTMHSLNEQIRSSCGGGPYGFRRKKKAC